MTGALVALAIDVALLVAAVMLVVASVSPAMALVITGAIGLILAPLLGWRYGRLVLGDSPGWIGSAFRVLFVIAAVLAVCVLIYQTFEVPVQGGVAARLEFIAYAAVIDAVVVLTLAFVVVVPMGIVWTRLMRTLARHRLSS